MTPTYRFRLLPTWLLLAAGVFTSLPAAAQTPSAPPVYGVEIVVFRVSNPGNGEDWTVTPPVHGFGSTASRGGAEVSVIKVLPASDYRLAGVEGTLRSSGAWRPIAHAAWIQTAPNWGTHTGIALSDLGINVPGLTGTVYLERGTYLHLGFDVTLTVNGASYRIDNMHDVKYNDRQYFDHPAFGIIAVVTPIKR